MSGSLAGKVALVTGATSGIGAACARLFAQRGASVMLAGRSAERGSAMVLAIERDGGAADFTAGDVRELDCCESMVRATCERFGRLDVLVNSAGIWHSATASETSDAQWRETIEVNVTGLFFVSRAALRVMLAQRSGNIVNISSDWGLVGGREAAAYCASKGAVVLLTKAMALDHAADGIRINVLCPADTDTPMMEQDYRLRGIPYEEGKRLSGAAIPMGRMARAIDVAEAACFLASDAASFITGVSLPIDGGETAR
ncbi:MAG TPA: SDR family oxidoreductase [Myxococcota bacterium]|nr:SDR family oxidoreductase [Myxococcota bacterium]